MRAPRLALVLAAALPVLAGFPPAAGAAEHEPEPRSARPAKPASRVIPSDVRFDQDFTDGNLVKMTITNYGFYGNNFFKRDASLEYPANRGYEHMVRGGLWVGARDQNGVVKGVTTGTVDAAQGPSSPDASEFTPANKSVLKRSILKSSQYFDGCGGRPECRDSPRSAVSELDCISDFNDTTLTQAASNSEFHHPLQILVHHENFQWSFSDFKNILFFRITVKNIGPLLKDVFVGIYSEFASGYKDGYVVWPPGGGDAGGLGSWFNRKWVVYDDSLDLVREHFCYNKQPPDNCIMERAPYWIGLRYLGARTLAEDTTTAKYLTLSGWNWQPGNADRNEDTERYALMSSGKFQNFEVDSFLPQTGDPAELFTVGPFPFLYNDSTVTVNFAIVGGSQVADIQRYSKLAQFAFDNNYIIPRSPDPPRVHVVAREDSLDCYWDNTSESSEDPTSPNPKDFEGYRVYIGDDPDTLARIAQFDLPGDTASFNTGFDRVHLAKPVVIEGDTMYYKYSIGSLRDGFKHYVVVTAFDIGNRQIESLESGITEVNRRAAVPGPAPGERKPGPTVFPNPYRVEARWDTKKLVRDHFLWFANLPQRCTLRIYTLAGDLVFEKQFDGSTYAGEDARGTYNPSKGLGTPQLSGTMYGWNMITRQGEAVATGLYLYSVEDRDTGDRTVGKFLIVKSDRETTQ